MKQSAVRRTKHNDAVLPPHTLETELYRTRQQEQYRAFVGLQEPISHAMTLLDQRRDAITLGQCDEVEGIFQEVQLRVQGCLSALLSPDMDFGTRPYTLLLRLWSFHRTVVEAQVVAGNVRGMSEKGRLRMDLTGSYWQLRSYLLTVARTRQKLLHLLRMEALQPSKGTASLILHATSRAGASAATAGGGGR